MDSKMNERIDELIFQVGFTRLHYPDDNFLDGRYALTQEQLDKFAELIVRECIDQCADNGSNDEWDKGVRWAANQIKQHFGVKE
jgi:hypothetical protein